MAADLTRRDLFKKSAVAGAAVAAGPGLAAVLDARTSSPTSTSTPTSGGRGSTPPAGGTPRQAAGPFSSGGENRVAQAAKDMGVNYSYDAPPTFDMVKMSQLIDSKVASKPDGLIVSIPDASALGGSIKSAVSAGIPVISINSGSDVYKSLGALTHIGQTEELAGMAGGENMGKAGVQNALCINQEQGNAALELRCKGFQEGLVKTGGKVTELVVDLQKPTETAPKITNAFQRSPYAGVLALGPTGAAPALAALQAAGKLGQIKLGTFDLSADVLSAVAAGNMLFAIDQQQYLQGYLPIVILTLFKLYLLLPG